MDESGRKTGYRKQFAGECRNKITAKDIQLDTRKRKTAGTWGQTIEDAVASRQLRHGGGCRSFKLINL